jgi:hypothetical protein
MKSIKRSRIVVVADSDQGRILAARLRRMEVAEVTAVAGLEEARRLCQSGSADVCLVAVGNPVPDCVPAPEGDAPGRACGIPALMVAPVVTPHVRRTARRCGYLAAISATMPPRMLYRRLGAALQRRSAARRTSRPSALGAALVRLESSPIFDKPTLH